MANQKTVNRYRQFPLHTNRNYHSASLPLPNVVRIEVLAPEAKVRYLGKFHSMMDGFRQALTESLMPPDANKPFYAFYDPVQNGDIGFDVSAGWEPTQNAGINGAISMIKALPGGVGKFIGDKAEGVAKVVGKGVRMMGMNNDSTGSCTMKTFSKADFQFNKTVKCSWYMPEQEDMARVSLSRLIRMAYVRNFDMDKRNNFGKKLADALRTIPKQLSAANQVGGETGGVAGLFTGAVDGISHLAAGIMDSDAINSILTSAVNAGISLNEFFGGSLTINPLPVRLTMGHQLDIEPLVITNIKVSGSQEQFMTTDGSNIPLFVNMDISFAMWMIPDPNKGFVQYLGDDLFNVGYSAGKSIKTQNEEHEKGLPLVELSQPDKATRDKVNAKPPKEKKTPGKGNKKKSR